MKKFFLMPFVLCSIGFELGAVERTSDGLEKRKSLLVKDDALDKLIKIMANNPSEYVSIEEKIDFLDAALRNIPMGKILDIFIEKDISIEHLVKKLEIFNEEKSLTKDNIIRNMLQINEAFVEMSRFGASILLLNHFLRITDTCNEKNNLKQSIERKITLLSKHIDNIIAFDKKYQVQIFKSLHEFTNLLKKYQYYYPSIFCKKLEENCEEIKKTIFFQAYQDILDSDTTIAIPISPLDFLYKKNISNGEKVDRIVSIINSLDKESSILIKELYDRREEISVIFINESKRLKYKGAVKKSNEVAVKLKTIQNFLKKVEENWKKVEESSNLRTPALSEQSCSNPLLEEKVGGRIYDNSLVKKEEADFVSDESVSWKKVLPDLLKSLNSLQDSKDLDMDLFFIQSHIEKIIACLSEDLRVAKDDATKEYLLEIEDIFKGIETFIPTKHSLDENIVMNSFEKYALPIIKTLNFFSIIK